MVMYALAIDPLMKKYAHDTIQVWYADNASASRTASELFSWWEKLVEHGPQFGYCPKACKSSVVVKEGFEGKAPEVFQDSVSPKREACIWESPLGSANFQNSCIDEKVQEW